MQQLPPSGLNYPFSKAARALLPLPFVVIFAQPCPWPCATLPVGLWTWGQAVRLQVGQKQDSSGRKGTREKEQLARWLGVCHRWSHQCQVPVPLGGRPGGLASDFTGPLQVSSRNVHREEIPFCMARVCLCLAA